jgi:hypothetical protein
MWQLQWVISLIPDAVLNWVYWLIIIVGLTGMAAAWIGKWIPFYGKYVGVLKPVGIFLLVLGVWLRGGYDVEMAWRDKVAKLEAQVKLSEEKSTQANVQIKTVVKEKIKKVKEYQIVYQDRIKEVEKVIDADCRVPTEAITILNDSAKLRKGTVTIEPVNGGKK